MKNQNKDHVLYVAKVAPDRFKYGITRDVRKRILNLITTGYGNAVLIAESVNLCSKSEALELESFIKNAVVRGSVEGEYCTIHQVRAVMGAIKAKYGINVRKSIDVDIQNLPDLSVAQKLKLAITPEIIKNATCNTTGYCVIAEALRREGFASPNVQVNGITFNRNGKRYFCPSTKEACFTLLQFDTDRTKVKPHTITLEVMNVKEIRSNKSGLGLLKAKKKGVKKTKSAVAKTKKASPRGRHHGLSTAIKLAV